MMMQPLLRIVLQFALVFLTLCFPNQDTRCGRMTVIAKHLKCKKKDHNASGKAKQQHPKKTKKERSWGKHQLYP